MRRISVLILLPLILFGLERVNLIKDHSFEKDSEVWHSYISGTELPPIALVSTHDPEYSYCGNFSGSSDTRPKPNPLQTGDRQDVYITQGFLLAKTLEDIDSIIIQYSILPYMSDFSLSMMIPVLLHLNANREDYWKAGYLLKCESSLPGQPQHVVYLEWINLPVDSLWYSLERDIRKDINEWVVDDIPDDATLDSLILWSEGLSWEVPWRGQKVFFDDVRLMGYADYDVGVKEITSPEGKMDIPYRPKALIKNFGREPADSFLAIATMVEEIEGDTVYADTIPLAMSADTAEEITFSYFPSSRFKGMKPGLTPFTLYVRTIMEPDESDADDMLSQDIYCIAITEPSTPPVRHPDALDLRVNPISFGDVHVSYNMPQGFEGTLTLFDASGRRVDTKQVRGYGLVELSSEMASGVYIVKLEVGCNILSRKVVVVR